MQKQHALYIYIVIPAFIEKNLGKIMCAEISNGFYYATENKIADLVSKFTDNVILLC